MQIQTMQNLLIVSLYALGIIAVIALMVIIMDATAYAIRKNRAHRTIDELVRNKIEKGEFYVVERGESDGMEDEEADS